MEDETSQSLEKQKIHFNFSNSTLRYEEIPLELDPELQTAFRAHMTPIIKQYVENHRSRNKDPCIRDTRDFNNYLSDCAAE